MKAPPFRDTLFKRVALGAAFWLFVSTAISTEGNLLKQFVSERFSIPSAGMAPNLLPGDHVFVDKMVYRRDDPKRGDLVVFRYPDDPSHDFLKRIVGLPGDRIDIFEGRLSINGELVNRVAEGEFVYRDVPKRKDVNSDRYRESNPEGVEYSIIHSRPPRTRSRGPWRVPPGEYFMMGDHRDNSRDSREWRNAYVRADQIKGKVVRCYYSIIHRAKPCS